MLVNTLISTNTRFPFPIIPNALDDLYRQHHAMVFRTAYRITGNAADAEDVLQTVFLRMVRTGRFGRGYRISRKLPAPGGGPRGTRSGPRQA